MKRRPDLLILAGGFGTRLRAAVSRVPKPLAPVAGYPYLRYLVENWVEQGVRRMVFLLHHQAESIRTFLESHSTGESVADCELHALIEPQPLGTGGAVAFAVRQLHLTTTFLVTNADTWLATGAEEVFDCAAPAMAVVRVPHSDRYGSVRISENRVIGFEEKNSSAAAGWINAGLYHLHPDPFQHWNGQPFSLERELFPKLASTGHLKAVALNTDFIDIGIPEDYFRFCRWVESGRTGPL